MQKIRFFNIEFLRIVMIFGIVMHHAFANRTWSLCNMFPDVSLYAFLKKAFWFANNGVEGFFIIAGLFFVLTFNSNLSFLGFFAKKYIRLAPVILFATFLCYLSSFWGLINFNLLNNVLTVLLLNNFIIRWSNGSVGSVWYVSALIAGFAFYYCVKKYVKNPRYYYVILFLLTFFGYLMLEVLKHGNYGGPGRNFGVLNIGMLRCIGGLGLGIIIGEFFKNKISIYRDICFGKIAVTFVSLIELVLLVGIVWWIFVPHLKYNNIVFVIVFSLLLILFILNKGVVSNFFNKNIYSVLSKYVYSIFVTHTLVYKLFSYHFWSNYKDIVNVYNWLPVVVNFLLVIILGVFTYHFVEKPCAQYFKERAKSLVAVRERERERVIPLVALRFA